MSEFGDTDIRMVPLAERMRPHRIEDVIGQDEVVAPGSALRLMALKPEEVTVAAPGAVVLYGPPGTGKTTLSQIVAEQSGRHLMKLSAVDLTTEDLTATLASIYRLRRRHEESILFIDEVHRLSRAQQDILLPVVENRTMCFIAATTEPPASALQPALLSRCIIVHLHHLTQGDIAEVLDRATVDPMGLRGEVRLDPEARKLIVISAGGDARRALTTLEAAASRAVAGGVSDGAVSILSEKDVRAVIEDMPRYSLEDRNNMSSALIKSMRGSDPDATIYWTTRMLDSGEEPKFVAKKIILAAANDVGMADPEALRVAVSAAQAADILGMPDARIPLLEAAVTVAVAPKSDSLTKASAKAMQDIRDGYRGDVPEPLQMPNDDEEQKEGHAGRGYMNPHDYDGIVRQNYLPLDMADADTDYYEPKDSGEEARFVPWLQQFRQFMHGGDPNQQAS